MPDPWPKKEAGNTNHPIELLWLHGWGLDHQSLNPLANLLGDRTHSILFDLPGFGQTPRLQKGAGTEDYAKALLKELGPKTKPRIFVSHSFGGRISVRFATLFPEEVDALVMIAGAGLRPRRTLAFKLRATALKYMGRLTKLSDRLLKTSLRERFQNRFGSRDYKNAGDLRETFVRVVNEDLSEIAPKVNVPVLLIYGNEDTETPPDIGQRYASLMPNAHLKILDGFNHNDILSRGANRLDDLIRKFMDQVIEQKRHAE